MRQEKVSTRILFLMTENVENGWTLKYDWIWPSSNSCFDE